MVAMNSMPQQEVANGKGQMEFLRASPTTFSRLVAKKPAPSIPGGFSARLTLARVSLIDLLVSIATFSGSCLLVLILMPTQRALPHGVQETHQQKGNKHHHFNNAQDTHVAEIHRPRIHENHLHIEQHKEDCYKKVPDMQRQPCVALRFDSAFERLKLHFCFSQGTQLVRNDHGDAYEQNRQQKHE